MAKIQLKKFDAAYQGAKVSVPTITIKGNGVFSITPSALEKMGLKPADKVSLFQDESSGTDWYIAKDKDGMQMRDGKGSGMFSSALVARKIFESIDLPYEGAMKFQIGESDSVVDKQPLWPILTANPIDATRKRPE